MYNLGLDLGTSFIKAALTECSSGNVVNVVSQPSSEQKIKVFKDGWAEQDPEIWWKNTCLAIKNLISLTELHSKKCNLYRNYIDTIFPGGTPIERLPDLPWMPVRAFKEFDLKSIADDDVYKIMQSSGTGGVQSKIFLDQETSKLRCFLV